MIKDTIQNFQFSWVRTRTYSSNISFILLVRWRDTGAPVAGNNDWQLLKTLSDTSDYITNYITYETEV